MEQFDASALLATPIGSIFGSGIKTKLLNILPRLQMQFNVSPLRVWSNVPGQFKVRNCDMVWFSYYVFRQYESKDPTMSLKELVIALFTAAFADHDPEAARQLVTPGYIQHNPQIPTGAEGLVGLIPLVEQSGMTVTTHRVISEGDLVVLHSTFENADAFGAPTLAAFDVFRVEDGKVAEHWDNLQPVPETTASGRGMTDGPTEITDLDKTEENKALVLGFVRDVLGGAAPEKAPMYSEVYMQHNPHLADGIDGLMAGTKAWAEQGFVITKFEPQIVVAEGNFVFVASDATVSGKPWAFFDLWRVEDGKIVEHWDVVSATPEEMAHNNGKF